MPAAAHHVASVAALGAGSPAIARGCPRQPSRCHLGRRAPAGSKIDCTIGWAMARALRHRLRHHSPAKESVGTGASAIAPQVCDLRSRRMGPLRRLPRSRPAVVQLMWQQVAWESANGGWANGGRRLKGGGNDGHLISYIRGPCAPSHHHPDSRRLSGPRPRPRARGQWSSADNCPRTRACARDSEQSQTPRHFCTPTFQRGIHALSRLGAAKA